VQAQRSGKFVKKLTSFDVFMHEKPAKRNNKQTQKKTTTKLKKVAAKSLPTPDRRRQ
jgi:hypothetical protein